MHLAATSLLRIINIGLFLTVAEQPIHFLRCSVLYYITLKNNIDQCKQQQTITNNHEGHLYYVPKAEISINQKHTKKIIFAESRTCPKQNDCYQMKHVL